MTEKYTLTPYPNNTLTIQSDFNGRYVGVNYYGNNLLIANSDFAKEWENFTFSIDPFNMGPGKPGYYLFGFGILTQSHFSPKIQFENSQICYYSF